ncbi:ABC transporter permease subunit [Azospirillum brasilense]|uniref:ABC transporter permease n=1 Tax=Azospirillum brasilense TaxID=192 RepID=UPI00157B2E31|nr:ABC transporter permease subunit [Azospirillum brasilense]NUB28011.1 ABC transporter permease subunit [Azospirillum brasilense]
MHGKTDTLLVIVALVALWQVLHWIVGSVALTSPAHTPARAVELLGSATFWPHVAETGVALLYSLLLAVLGGLTIGIALGINRLAGEVAEPILVSLYSLPKITLYPVILLAFGLGLSAKVAFGTIHGIVPVIIFTMNAVRTIPPVMLRSARVMRLSQPQLVSTIILPAALPELVSGLRVGFSLTLLGVLIGEMFASQRGLGYLVMNAIGGHDVRTMMAVVLILATTAVLISAGLLHIDRRMHRRAS